MNRIWIVAFLFVGTLAFDIVTLSPTTDRTDNIRPTPEGSQYDPNRYSLFVPLYAKNVTVAFTAFPVGIDCSRLYFYARAFGVICDYSNSGSGDGSFCGNYAYDIIYSNPTSFEFSQGYGVSDVVNMDFSLGVTKYYRDDAPYTCYYNVSTYYDLCPFDQVGWYSYGDLGCHTYTNATFGQSYTVNSNETELFRYISEKFTGNITISVTANVDVYVYARSGAPTDYDSLCYQYSEDNDNGTFTISLTCAEPSEGDLWIGISADEEYSAELSVTATVCPTGTMGASCEFNLANIRELSADSVFNLAPYDYDYQYAFFYLDFEVGEMNYYNISFGSSDPDYVYFYARYGNVPNSNEYNFYKSGNSTFQVTPYDSVVGGTIYFSAESESSDPVTVVVNVTKVAYVPPTDGSTTDMTTDSDTSTTTGSSDATTGSTTGFTIGTTGTAENTTTTTGASISTTGSMPDQGGVAALLPAWTLSLFVMFLSI